ncbi:MAG: tetratricopeptide repeat protein [Actinomycetota bacterium]|nr:tetratricopeptide repeat protein [Actinomycetota bacterium]
MARSSVVTESEAVVSRTHKKKYRPWPSRAILVFLAGGLIVLLAVGYLGFFGSTETKTKAAAGRLKLQGQRLYRAKKYDQAADFLNRYLGLAPKDQRTRELLAQIYWQIGDGWRAFAELNIVNRSSAPNGDRFYRLGLLADQMGKRDESVVFLKKAVALKPESMLFRVELAKSLTKLEHYDEAVVQWQEAIDRLPDKDLYAAVIYAELGDVLRLKGDIEKAKEAYRRGLEIEPGNVYLQAQIAGAGGQ